MGTIVGIRSPEELPERTVKSAVAVLHDVDRLFSLWNPNSPMARLRSGQVDFDDLEPTDAEAIRSVLLRCEHARLLSQGAFDPWALPGGVDPTGLVKGWAVRRARDVLVDHCEEAVMVNCGGDMAVAGKPHGRSWRVGIRDPLQPTQLAAIVEVTASIATSGNYERPGELFDPHAGRTARGVASATVTGPELDLVDALATALAVRGIPLLDVIANLPGFGAYLITETGKHYGSGQIAFTNM